MNVHIFLELVVLLVGLVEVDVVMELGELQD
jgi:hypothetical protein